MVAATKAPQLWEVAGDDLRMSLHPGQWRAWQSEKRFIFMLAGTQSGKTSYGPLWLYREIQRRGPGDYLAVTSTFPLLKLKMLPEFRRFFEVTLGCGTWRHGDRTFVFSAEGAARTFSPEHLARMPDTPTRVIFGSATNPDALESATAKGAWLDEVGQDTFRLESWEAILRRLSLNQGRVLGGTTLYNLGWLKQVIYDPWRAGERPDTEVIQFNSVLNPMFPLEEYERAKATLPDWKFRLFYNGEFARPAGLIYHDFNDEYRERGGHKTRPFDLPPEWPRVVGVDFGATNTARLCIAHDPAANVSYVYDELLAGDKTTAEHAAALKRDLAGVNLRTVHGGSKSETQQRMDWQAAGVMMLEPEVSDVEAGIDRVIALFKTSRLYVFDTCRGLLDELGTYSRDVDELNQPLEKIKNKERYHRLDALRYAAQGLDAPPPASATIVRENPWERPSRSLWR